MKRFRYVNWLLLLLLPLLFFKLILPVLGVILVIVLIGFAALVVKAKKEGRSIDADFLRELVKRDNGKVIDAEYKEREHADDTESAGK